MCSAKSSHALRISCDVKKCLSLEIIEVHGWMWDLQMLTGGGFGDIIYEHVEAILSELRSGVKSELPTPPC